MLTRSFEIICSNSPSIQYNTHNRWKDMASQPPSLPFQHHFFFEFRTSTVNKHARPVEIGQLQIWKPLWSLVFLHSVKVLRQSVSFIYLSLVFSSNFRIIFLPHTNTVNLLESYCGNITELGLPVFDPAGNALGLLTKVKALLIFDREESDFSTKLDD